jgi:hypothetical protein
VVFWSPPGIFDFAVAQELSGCFDLPLTLLRFVLAADEKNRRLSFFKIGYGHGQ